MGIIDIDNMNTAITTTTTISNNNIVMMIPTPAPRSRRCPDDRIVCSSSARPATLAMASDGTNNGNVYLSLYIYIYICI